MDDIYIKKENVEKWIGKFFPKKDLISILDLISCIEDLDADVEKLQEEIENLKQDIEDNYISRPNSDYTGNTRDDWR